MFWLLIAFLGPVFHGMANILDNYFTNKLFKNTTTLIFYSSLTNLLFLPLIFLIGTPQMIPVSLLPFFILVGIIEVVYLYPYFKALKAADTSIVTSLFSIGKIFVPILAFLIVGEVLSLAQYVGFFVIVLSGAILTLNNHRKIKFNKAFFYMGFCSLILSFEAVIYKYIFNNVGWATGFAWALAFSSLFVFPILFFKQQREDIKAQMSKFKNKLHLFLLGELLTFGGEAGVTYAISLTAVTLVKGIGSFQPFFVLLYAILFSKLFPHVFKEKIDARSIIKKSILFIIMLLGIFLIIS